MKQRAFNPQKRVQVPTVLPVSIWVCIAAAVRSRMVIVQEHLRALGAMSSNGSGMGNLPRVIREAAKRCAFRMPWEQYLECSRLVGFG